MALVKKTFQGKLVLNENQELVFSVRDNEIGTITPVVVNNVFLHLQSPENFHLGSTDVWITPLNLDGQQYDLPSVMHDNENTIAIGAVTTFDGAGSVNEAAFIGMTVKIETWQEVELSNEQLSGLLYAQSILVNLGLNTFYEKIKI